MRGLMTLLRPRTPQPGSPLPTNGDADAAWDGLLAEAIAGRRLIGFVYHGAYREAEPHAYGRTERGRKVLVYQVGGRSAAGALPAWRRVRLEEVAQLSLLPETFAGPRRCAEPHRRSFEVLFATVG